MKADLDLLSKYHQKGDALAFRELVHSHSGMVYATARRITRDDAMAQDVSQETFVKLARQSKNITESVAAWLHRVASRLACNALRDETTRRRNEDEAATTTAPNEEKESPWSDVEPELDAVIDELPEEMRAPLVMHFLEGRNQRDIARELKISQSTVSRAIDSGLAELRKRLRGRGVFCGLGLGTLLLANSASAAPAKVVASLSKIGMSGIGGNGLAAAAAAGAGTAAALKIAASMVAVAGIVTIGVAASNHAKRSNAAMQSIPVSKAEASPATVPLIAPPQRLRTPAQSRSQALPAEKNLILPVMPVHELVHSFPQTLPRPFGSMVRDADGWIWGTTRWGGEYGCGTVFKVRPGGSDWQEVLAFSGKLGAHRGQHPRGLMLAKDGTLLGTTESGGENDGGTLFVIDRSSGELTTCIDFGPETGDTPGVAVVEASDGGIWGTTRRSVFRFDRTHSRYDTIASFTGKSGRLPGDIAAGGLTADEQGALWGSTKNGGTDDVGSVFRVDLQSKTVRSIASFTGKSGILPGNAASTSLTFDHRGFMWGSTIYGGADDSGVIFRVDIATGSCATVAQFTTQGPQRTGSNPESALTVDADGNLWGGASYSIDYGKGSGNVFKFDRASNRILPLFYFTGKDGSYPGGPLRCPLLAEGAGGFIGATNFGGQADFGVIFHLDAATGGYSVLKDLASLVVSKDGAEPRGRLVAGSDGCLWGVAQNNGLHHQGTVFKFDPITDALVTVVDFTGNTGAVKGSFPRAGLASDGLGFLWGVTTGGGTNERGTIYRINERTGAFNTMHEFGTSDKRPGPAGSGPETELVNDRKGFLWGTTRTSVFKISTTTGAFQIIARFTGEQGPFFGTEPEALALDDRGFIWGSALGEPRKATRGCIFKIDTSTHALTIVESLLDARRGSSSTHYRQGDMYWDGRSMWYAGAFSREGSSATRTLLRIDTNRSAIAGIYKRPGDSGITTPVVDERGLLWGLSAYGRNNRDGSVYAFDPATEKFASVFHFTGQGSQARTGEQPIETRFYRHTDGNLYAGTRYGGPGNGGTIFRLRFGPTPITQEATLLADGSAELRGTLRPNGKDSEAAFEWGTEPSLANAASIGLGAVRASDTAKALASTVRGLKPATTYYFRLRGKNENNRVAQRGAIMSFVTPATLLADNDNTGPANSDSSETQQGATSNAASEASKHALNVVRIPGAGAGLVTGALQGRAYEIGKRYTLTALADNDYIFSHWTAPGITGTQAENRVLSFVFTEELAKSPVITATFVKNPFQQNLVGSFNGLVLPAEGVAPDITSTGALRISVAKTGNFTGELLYDQRRIPLLGAFDIGGLARFGATRLPSLSIPPREGSGGMLLSLQLDLNPSSSNGIAGTIAAIVGNTPRVRSIGTAERSFFDGIAHPLPAGLLANGGRYALKVANDESDSNALLLLASNGSATFAAKLHDGTGVIAGAPLSQLQRAAFFAPLYTDSSGSFGGAIVLPELFGDDATLQQQPFWWCQPAPKAPWQDVIVRLSAAE